VDQIPFETQVAQALSKNKCKASEGGGGERGKWKGCKVLITKYTAVSAR
jgi:hypothetical protein